MTQAKRSEPPSAGAVTASNIFLVGRNSRGHWVAQDERGLCGGLFVDRSKAIRFAMDETGKRPQAIRLVTGVLELDLSRTAELRPLPARASRGLIAPFDSDSSPAAAREVQR
jgi:hypothetical protein